MNPEEYELRSEVSEGMRIDWNQPIEMDDGIVLRADVFRPVEQGRYPVILTYGIYAKGVAYQEGYAPQWQKMVEDYPEILEGSTNKYQNWEVTDPERWVPHGYVVIRVDSRGAGCSPGFMAPNSPREIDDFHQCIEWAGVQAWSSGKVGLLGISYYSRNQWRVAGHAPRAPHRDDPLGGRRRHLSRLRIPWRHPQPVPGSLVAPPGGQRPVRTRREGAEEPEHRTVGLRADHAVGRGTGGEPRERLRGTEEPSLRRRLASRALGGFLQGHGPLPLLRELGRTRHPPAGKLQRLHRSAIDAEMAGSARRFALVAVLQRLRAGAAETLLRPFPEGHRQWLGQDAQGAS